MIFMHRSAFWGAKMEVLYQQQLKECLTVIGLNSGTSMDGIDAILVDITDNDDPLSSPLKIKIRGFITHPYPDGLKADLMRLCTGEGKVGEVCYLNALVGWLFADAAKALVAKCGLKIEDVDVIGSHGQTVHHLPLPTSLYGHNVSSTLQIGDPSIIANDCGVTTIGDFRTADTAVGGEGAPLIPYLDWMLLRKHFRDTQRIGILLNIGGISNISTLMPSSTGDSSQFSFVGFDCGPGNVFIDLLAKRWFGQDYDKDAQISSSGTVSKELLDKLLEDDFLSRKPPKSTGREYFGEKYIDNLLEWSEDLRLSREDFMATITDFTAAAVWINYKQFIAPHFTQLTGSCSTEVKGYDFIVSGGGARNSMIMRGLQSRFEDFNVTTTEEIGIDPDSREALFFSVLAYQAMRGRPVNMSSVTGARKEVILGKICPVLRNK